MLFNRKSDSNSFPKEKLSHLALDHFVEQYSNSRPITPESLPYTTQSGKRIYFLTEKALESPSAIEHFKYLLGQTVPYHRPDTIENKLFYLTDLLYTVDSNKKITPWTTNQDTAISFVQIGQNLSLLLSIRQPRGQKPIYERHPDVKPIIH